MSAIDAAHMLQLAPIKVNLDRSILETRFQEYGGRRLIGATVDGLGRGSEVPPEFSRSYARMAWKKCDGGSMTFPAVVFFGSFRG